MINAVLNTGLQGLQQAQSRMSESADEIAHSIVEASTDNPDLAKALVELKMAEYDAKANLKVIETSIDMIGTLLDIKT